MTENEKLIEEAERGNRVIQAREHRQLFEAAARERLISSAATAILASEGIEPQEDGTYWGENTWPNAVKDARTALAVFEKAHTPTRTVIQITPEAVQREYELRNGVTPTDDERETLTLIVRDVHNFDGRHEHLSLAGAEAGRIADAILAAGFCRPEVQEPSAFRCSHCRHCDAQEPQGEPSDAQVRAAAESLAHSAGYIPEPMVRAALRAAGGVG